MDKKGNYVGGKLQDGMLQVRVSPVQMWDVSFPVEYKDAMLTTIFGTDSKLAGDPINKRHKKYASMLRLGLGVNKIPKDYNTSKRLACDSPTDMEIVGIGMKDDYYVDEQEMI